MEDHLMVRWWPLVDASECTGAVTVTILPKIVPLDWPSNVNAINPHWTHPKQIIVHFLGVVIIFAMHAHEQIFDIDNGAQQLIDLFIGDVAQMRYMIIQRMLAVRVPTFLCVYGAIICFNLTVSILLWRLPSSTTTFGRLACRVHRQFGHFLLLGQFVNL